MVLMASSVFAAVGLTALYTNQNKLIYPSWVQKSNKFVEKPNELQFSELLPYFKETFISTEDGIQLQVYTFNKPNFSEKKTLLIFRPNAGNIGHSLPRINYMFHKYDFNIVIWSYRGYGLSSGSPEESGIKSDCSELYLFLMNQGYISDTTSKNFNEPKLILLGTSIGGAVSIYFASEYPENIGALVLENTFLSLAKTIPYVLPWFKYLVPMCHEKWASESLIGNLNTKMSLLILSSMKDEVVPPSHSTRLYELSNSDEKLIRKFKNGYHNDIMFQKGYWEIIDEFMHNVI
ncbi:hypothetical protein QEN19_004007 [Hanseniaspora menglaensis]